MNTKTMIAADQCMIGAVYKGKGRNFNVGRWTGNGFIGMRFKFGQWFEDTELHYEACIKYGTFTPFEVVAYPDTLAGALADLRDRVGDLKKAIIEALKTDLQRIRKWIGK